MLQLTALVEDRTQRTISCFGERYERLVCPPVSQKTVNPSRGCSISMLRDGEEDGEGSRGEGLHIYRGFPPPRVLLRKLEAETKSAGFWQRRLRGTRLGECGPVILALTTRRSGKASSLGE